MMQDTVQLQLSDWPQASPDAIVIYSETTGTVGPNAYHVEQAPHVPLCGATGPQGSDYRREAQAVLKGNGARLCKKCRRLLTESGREHIDLRAHRSRE